MLNHRVVMTTDADAAATDADHNAALSDLRPKIQ
jgi:hypothetical protein